MPEKLLPYVTRRFVAQEPVVAGYVTEYVRVHRDSGALASRK